MRLLALTDVGISRHDNQDNYWSARLKLGNEEIGIVCLCDGMGGLDNGALASKIVVEAVRDFILGSSKCDIFGKTLNLSILSKVLSSANATIKELSKSSPNKMMGTTCTLLICYRGRYSICHVGDSRAYLVRKGIVTPLTLDHSAVREYNISKKENPQMWEKYKSKLTRCVGVKEEVIPDYYQGAYLDGDMFFLCSDGCWHYLDDVGFPTNIKEDKDLDILFSRIMEYGETDNITAGVLFV